MNTRKARCPVCCRRDVKVSRWTGRLKRHDGRAIGDEIWCPGRSSKTRGGQ